ncbi:MAG: glycosyltransferase family 4 protein [Oscillospiraceae bacterium]|nr:glycosyltransferase family 4 protein [Oscillospiraceae bacterium]
MRIVHISLTGTVTDGLGFNENLLSKYHVKLGHEVYLIGPMWHRNGKGAAEPFRETDYINADGVHMIRLPMRGRDDMRRKFKRFSGLDKALDEIRPDLIFIHGCAFADVPTIVRYLKKHPEVRAFADNHADYSNSATTWLSKNVLHRIIWRRCARSLIPVVEKFYGVLPARVDFIEELYGLPAEKCEYLPMGADDEYVEAAGTAESIAAVRQEYGIAEDDFLIVTGGKINPSKKQTLELMKAVREIEDPALRLIVFGSVNKVLKEDFHALVDGQKVQYIGWQQPFETYRLFAAADLAVFPGRHSVFWEQVTGQGIPMLIKDWPGTHHVDVGGNVRFLTEDSAAEIRAVIEHLRSHPEEYEAMRQAARENGMRFFSCRNIAERAIRET